MNTITIVTQKQGKTLSGVILSVKESMGEGCPDWESGFSIPHSTSTTLQLRKRLQKQLRTLEILQSNLRGGVLVKPREGLQVRDLGGPDLSSPLPTSGRECLTPFTIKQTWIGISAIWPRRWHHMALNFGVLISKAEIRCFLYRVAGGLNGMMPLKCWAQRRCSVNVGSFPLLLV